VVRFGSFSLWCSLTDGGGVVPIRVLTANFLSVIVFHTCCPRLVCHPRSPQSSGSFIISSTWCFCFRHIIQHAQWGGGFFKRGNGFHGCFLLHFSIFIPLLGLFLMDRLSCCCICCDKPFFLFVFPSRQVHIYLLILFPFSCWWWPESSGLEALVWQDFFFFSFCIILSLCKL